MPKSEIEKEMELAMYELAEAQRHEGAAKKLRYEATRRLARAHSLFKKVREREESKKMVTPNLK